MMISNQTERGFTILEVLIATVIIGIGLVAMMAMQVAFLSGTTTARDTTIATALGESMVEQFRMEGGGWNSRNPILTPGQLTQAHTPMLFEGVLVNSGRYGFVSNLGKFPFNHEGLSRDPSTQYANRGIVQTKSSVNGKYCIDARMEFMDGSNNEVIIGQVRVAWPAEKNAPWLGAPPTRPVACSLGRSLDTVIYDSGDFSKAKGDINVVHVPFSIMRRNI
jgi:prepilin-type N-terminal cleavage/methylation domain-containing protein